MFGVSFLFALLASFCFGMVAGPHPALSQALTLGVVAGLGMVGASFGINYQFSNRKFALWLVDAGYHLFQFLSFGLVYGLLG